MRWREASAALALFVLAVDGAAAQNFTRIYPLGLDPTDPAEAAAVPAVQLARAYLPEAIDLSDRLPPPGDQGKVGSCVSWATAYAARSYYSLIQFSAPRTDATHIASPAYLHQQIRSRKAACDDSGSNVLIAMNYLKAHGIPSLADFGAKAACDPDVPTTPNPTLGFQIRRPHRIYDRPRNDTSPAPQAVLDKMQQELARGNPVVIGMIVDGRLSRLAGSEVYTVRLGPSSNTMAGDHGKRGGHAVVIVGYDDRRQAVRILNSWGDDWADHGYGWISYASLRSDLGQAYTMDAGVKPPIPIPKSRPGANYIPCNAENAKPWPVCEAIEVLAGPLAAASLPKLATTAGKDSFHFGDTLGLTVTAPDFPSFLYLVYLQADGKVVNLLPRRGAIRQQTAPGTVLTFGDGEQGRARFRVGPPKGTEAVIAIAARSPIAELEALEADGAIYKVAAATKNQIDQSESPPDRAFLSVLKTGLLSRPDPNLLPREVAAAVLHVTIEP